MGDSNSFKHQVMKISIPETDMHVFGPAFVEVRPDVGSHLLFALSCITASDLQCYTYFPIPISRKDEEYEIASYCDMNAYLSFHRLKMSLVYRTSSQFLSATKKRVQKWRSCNKS